MRRLMFFMPVLVLVGLLSLWSMVRADHGDDPHTRNVHPMGHDIDPATFLGQPDGVRHVHSDLAFWGRLAFQGNYDGFRILDISAPGNPKLIVHQGCNGDQGDIVVWENILVRSWNSKKTTARDCDGQTVPAGWEGVHVFDISDLTNPELVASVELLCGSHTVTVAGISNNDLIVYSNNSSGAGCTGGPANGGFMDIIAVPLDNAAGASLIHREPLAGPATAVTPGCHDVGVILGDVNKAACASADTINVFDISYPRDPILLFTISEPGVGQASTNGRWHSASFTWDGQVIVAGWEPGGGAAPECEAEDPAVKKSAFFYDATTGAKLGQWTLGRPQTALENCTIHNYNVVPLRSGRYVFVHGSYQSGTSVVDFTDPANPVEVGYSDPPPVVPTDLGGAWSSYWYNNFMYESNITEGLNIFRLSDRATAGAMRLPYLNPQTQPFTIP